jgi:8-oxo-dGTP pyrophosphatase MutT (NUDIX family)
MPIPSRFEQSAGGVVYRKKDGQVEILMIEVPYSHGPTWTFPKGHVEEGETPEQAAIREIEEETGIKAEIKHPLGDIDYWFISRHGKKLTRIHKKVTHFLLEATGGDTSLHNEEVTEADWFPLEEVEGKLLFDGDKKVFEKAKEILENP